MQRSPKVEPGLFSVFLAWVFGRCGACYSYLSRYVPLPSLPPHARRTSLGRYVADRLLNLILAYPTDTWEFSSAVLAIGWGVWVAFFPDLMSLRLYSGFRESFGVVEGMGLSSNVFLGGIVAFSGAVSFLSLFLSRFDALRVYASAWLAVVWLTIAWGFGVSELMVITPEEVTHAAVQAALSAFQTGATVETAQQAAVRAVHVSAFHTEGWRLTSTPVYGTFFVLSLITFGRLHFQRKHRCEIEEAEVLSDAAGC